MTETSGRGIIPPRPPLPPKQLKAAQKREARARAKEQLRAVKRADRAEKKAARSDQAHFHGHSVISSADLRQVFTDEDRVEDPVRFRHQLTHGVTLTVLVGIVVVGVVLALLVWKGYIKLPEPVTTAQATNSSNCPSATFDLMANKEVYVNIYNATGRDGLAASVAAELKQRGYQVGTVGNKKIASSAAAVISAGSAGQAAAFNLQGTIAETKFVPDTRSDSTVDLYLTSGFTALVDANNISKAGGKLSCSEPAASSAPSGSASATP